jgi:hypothetical protein
MAFGIVRQMTSVLCPSFSRGEIAVKHSIRFMVLLTAAIVVRIGRGVGRGETKPDKSKSDGKQGKPIIAGNWRVDSVSMTLPGGGRRTLSGKNGPASVTTSEKAFISSTPPAPSPPVVS